MSVSAQPNDAASLLALHRRYVGWQYGDGTFNSIREAGTLTKRDDRTGAVTTIGPVTMLRLGPLYRSDTPDVETGSPISSGFTGHLFWASDVNGFTRPIYGDGQKARISLQYVWNEGFDALPSTLEPAKTIDGVSYPVVRVTPSGGFSIDLCIDSTTGALKGFTIDPDGTYEETFDVLAYAQAVPGKRVVSSYKVDGNPFAVTYSHFEPNVTVTGDELHPPPQTASWDFANPKPFTIHITTDRVLVDATIDGTKGTFILDTGAAGVLLDAGFADRAHVEDLHKPTENFGIGGEVATQACLVRTLTVGGNTLSNLQVRTQNLEKYDYRGLDAKGYDGLIGYDLFANAIVKLSFSDGTMTISDPSTTDLSDEHGALLTVNLAEEIPAVPMLLDGEIEVSTLMDSGAPGLVLFSQDLVYKDHLRMLRADAIIGGVGGYEVTECGDIESMKLGPVTYEHEMGCEAGLLVGRQALVGFDFLKHFNIVFDYPHSQIILEPIQ